MKEVPFFGMMWQRQVSIVNIRSLRRWLIPAALLLITLFVNRVIGVILIAGYLVYAIWTNRPAMLAQVAIRKYRQGDLAGAHTWFAKAARLPRADGTILLSFALVLLKRGSFEEAEAQMTRAAKLALSDYNRNALASMRGIIEWKTGDPAKAIDQLASLAEDFRNTNLFGALGSLYNAEERTDEGLEFNLEAYDFDPYDSVIADNLARTRYLRGEYEEAEELLDEILERQPPIPEPYLNKALILESREEIEEAGELVHRARGKTYSHLSYLAPEELETICERIESQTDQE